MAKRSSEARRWISGTSAATVAHDAQRPLARVEEGRHPLRDLRVQRVEEIVRQGEDAAPVGGIRIERDHEDRHDDQDDAEDRYAETKQRAPAPTAHRNSILGDVYDPLNGRHAPSESYRRCEAWLADAGNQDRLKTPRTIFEQAGLVYR